MSSAFFCSICQIQCNGQAPYDQHVASAKHLKKANEASATLLRKSNEASAISLNVSTNDDQNSKATNLSRVPSIEKSFTSSFDSLLTSDTTISKETMQILLEWNHPMNYKPFCQVCQLVLHGGDNATMHFSSENRIHQEKLNACKRISQQSVDYSCSICSEIFDSENLMVEHFYSDSHDETKKRKLLLEKFIQIYETFNQLKTIRRKRLNDSSVTDPSFSHVDKKSKNTFFSSDQLRQAIYNAKIAEEEELDLSFLDNKLIFSS